MIFSLICKLLWDVLFILNMGFWSCLLLLFQFLCYCLINFYSVVNFLKVLNFQIALVNQIVGMLILSDFLFFVVYDTLLLVVHFLPVLYFFPFFNWNHLFSGGVCLTVGINVSWIMDLVLKNSIAFVSAKVSRHSH